MCSGCGLTHGLGYLYTHLILLWSASTPPQSVSNPGPNYSVLIKGEVLKATHVLTAWLHSSSLRTAPVSFSTLLFIDDSLLRCWGRVTTDAGTQIIAIWPGGFRLWKSKAVFAGSTVVHLNMLRLSRMITDYADMIQRQKELFLMCEMVSDF